MPPAATTGQLRASFVAPRPDGSCALHADAVLSWRDGRLLGLRDAETSDGAPSGLVVVPGLVDLHVHWPQSHVRGAFAGALLPWLRDFIWPAEAAFSELDVARQRAGVFLADLAAAGTTAALTFGPPYLEASLALLAVAPRGIFDGPALMQRNCPVEMARPVQAALAAMETLSPALRSRLVVSPRFAPNVDADGLRACGVAAARWRAPIQSHLSENVDEVAWVGALFPEATDYTDVYDRGGLLGPRTVLAHAVHLSERELLRLAQSRTVIAHCPSSNEALQSGRMPLERLRAADVRWVLASDVGAGPSLSLLHVLGSAMRAHRGAGVTFSAAEGLCRASRIPGAFLAALDPSLAGLGTFDAGAPAHFAGYTIAAERNAEATVEALVEVVGAGERPADLVLQWGQAVVGGAP